MTSRINWLKVIANMGITLFSVLTSTLTIDSLCGGKIPIGVLVLASFMAGFVQAGLTFFRELYKYASNQPPDEGCPPSSSEGKSAYRETCVDRKSRQLHRLATVCHVLSLMTVL